MHLNTLPVFNTLPDPDALLAHASIQHKPAGDVLFYEGDPPDTLIVLAAGRCAISRGGVPSGELAAPALLDPVATLGGLPHSVKITLLDAGEVWIWPVRALWDSPDFAAAARRFLASGLQTAQTRLDELEAPVHYANHGGQIAPGPFLFENVTLIFTFCEADLDDLALPDGLHLLRRPVSGRHALLLALAKFPECYPEHTPEARFGYTETTWFVPVRWGRRVGLFVPAIYPSAWEPILLGREIYGFPKQLGRTIFGPKDAALHVDGQPHAVLSWDALDASDEPTLVGALMGWMGLERHSAALAFRAGDVLRRVMRLPPYRSVSVYNHKQILAVDADPAAPTYAVNQLTHAIFGVLRWYQIARVRAPRLTVSSGPFGPANVTLRDAYRTQLAMRLSTGRVVRDY